ncbi:Kelch-like protein 31 [Acipenser ruthenus]|uniref:Kelch-like protein 31 n=1 Tax=Acipenser ruthenus TaxID=7906 RepID=A0A444V5G1_ACIRT|nr:Kelch-like protein 31 [Acipenser ruthenus]
MRSTRLRLDQEPVASHLQQGFSSSQRLLGLGGYDPRFNTWLHLASMRQRRTHFSLSALDGQLFAIGGRSAEGILSTVECYVPSSNAWQPRAVMEMPRCCHASATVNGTILVTGGYINSAYSRTVSRYDPTTDSWARAADLSTPRGWHCAASLGDRAYVVGGSQLGPRGERVDVLPVESFNPATGQWSYMAPLPVGVSTAGLTSVEGRLYLLGGWNESEKRYKKSVQTFDPALNEWGEDHELPEATVATMAPKKKSARQRQPVSLEKPLPVSGGVLIEETPLEVDHLNLLNGLRDSGSPCSSTEMTKSFDVHKLVMASCSLHFRELLKRDPGVQRVELDSLSPLGLASVITYAYMGKVNLSLYTIGCTVATATTLQIPQLVQMCSDFLLQEMSVENCMYISNIAAAYGLNGAGEAARGFIRASFMEFSRSDHFLRLTLEQIRELLSDDALLLPSELDAFHSALRWLEFDPPRSRHAAELLNHVRFGTIPAQELVSHVQPVPRMMQDPECHRLLVEAMNYHLLPFQQNGLQSQRTRSRAGRSALVAVGGRPSLTEKALSREVLCRDPDSLAWHKLSEMPAKSFNQCVAVMDGFLYDPRFNTWLHLASMRQRRTHFSLSALDGQLFAIGGRSAEGILSTVECYVPSSNAWQPRAVMEMPRCCHASATVNGTILVTGGYINSAYSRTVSRYDPTTDSWARAADLSTPRGWHCAASLGDRAYVVGGSQLGPRGERVDVLPVESFNPATGQWSYVAPLPVGVSTAGLTSVEGRLYLLGGWNESEKRYKKSVQTFDPALNEWGEDHELPEATVGVSCCTLTLPRSATATQRHGNTESRASSAASSEPARV